MMTGLTNQCPVYPSISRPARRWAFQSDIAAVGCWLVALLAVPMMSGCGGGSTHPVEGIVTFMDGTPVTGGNVVFSSLDLQPPVSAKGVISRDGTFSLGTLRPGDGAPEGKYRAVVSEPLPPDLDHPPPTTIHHRFGDFNTSGLEFEVVPGTNHFTILVERPENDAGRRKPR